MKRSVGVLAFTAALFLFSHTTPVPTHHASADTSTFIASAIAARPVGTQGETFFSTAFDATYGGGTAVLSSNSAGTGDIYVDDAIHVSVGRPDGTTATFDFDFSGGCRGFILPSAPANITALFQNGTNHISITFRDICGNSEGSSDFYLVIGSPPPPPLTLLGFFGGGPASEKECYALLAIVKNTSASAITRTLTLNESRTYRGFGGGTVGARSDSQRDCDGGGALSRTLTIPAGGSATFRFEIAHDWEWIARFRTAQELGSAFLTFYRLPSGVWSNLMLSVIRGTISIGSAVDTVLNAANAAPRVDYGYTVDTTGMAVSGSTSQTVNVSVNPWKIGYLRGSVTASIERAVVCPFIRLKPWLLPGCITAIAMQWSLYKAAFDPAPPYDVLVDPVPLPADALNLIPDGLPREYAADLLEEESFLIAAGESAIRAALAEEAGDATWTVAQLARARQLLQEAQLRRIAATSALRGMLINPIPDDEEANLTDYLALWTSYIPDVDNVETIIGEVSAVEPGFGEDLSDLFVANEARNQGYADALISLLESEIETRIAELDLQVQPVDQVSLDDLNNRQAKIIARLDIGWGTTALLDNITSFLERVDKLLRSTGDLTSLSSFLDFGHQALVQYSGLPTDNTPPTTSGALDPPVPDGLKGWYVSPVSVKLTATDGPDPAYGTPGSGVAITRYRVDEGPWTDYAGAFVVNTDSPDHKVEWASEDVAGNVEATQEIHFRIDQTRPILKVPQVANLWLCDQSACPVAINGVNHFTYGVGFNGRVTDLSPKGDPQTIGSFEFEVRFDAKLIDVEVTTGELLNRADVTCTQNRREGIVGFVCVTKGKSPEAPIGPGILANITARPKPDLFSMLIANQQNGIATQLINQDCQLADLQGHPIEMGLCDDAALTIRYLEGDVHADCIVDALDQQQVAFRWGSQLGNLLYNSRYDLEPSAPKKGDGDIDAKDLQSVFGRHGSTCSDPHPPQPPVDPKAK